MHNIQCWNCGHDYDYDKFLGCCPDCGALESDNPKYQVSEGEDRCREEDEDDWDLDEDYELKDEEPEEEVPFEDEHEEIDDDDTF